MKILYTISSVALVSSALLLSTSSQAQQPYRVECSSRNYQPQRCQLPQAPANVVILQQLSNNRGPCVQGQTWGFDYYGIWVTNGCRAVFAVYPYGSGPGYPNPNPGYPGGYPGYPGGGPGNPGPFPDDGYYGSSIVSCSSEHYRYQRCYAQGYIRAAQILRQISTYPGNCIEGRTWGYDRNSIWVDGGCRAQFRVYY